MYAPAPPAPPAGGWDPVGISSVALGPAHPGSGSVAATITAASTTTTLAAHSSTLNVLEWHPVIVTGTLGARPAVAQLAGRLVSLQALRGSRWSNVAIARTGRAGRFWLRPIPHRLGSARPRVRLPGDAHRRPAAPRPGRLHLVPPRGGLG